MKRVPALSNTSTICACMGQHLCPTPTSDRLRIGPAARGAALGGLLLMTSIGCTSAATPAAEIEASLSVSRGAPSYSLPLDGVSVVGGWDSYLSRVLISDCIAERGGRMDPGSPPSPSDAQSAVGASGRPLLDADAATAHGYRREESDQTPDRREPPRDAATSDAPPGEAECTSIADARVPTPPIEIASDLASEANELANSDLAVLDVVVAWRDCLIAAGYGEYLDPPDVDPVAFPERVLDRLYGATAPPSDSVAPAEVEVAVADAQCRRASGYSETFYNVEFDAQLEVIELRAADYAAATREFDEFIDELDEIGSELGIEIDQ